MVREVAYPVGRILQDQVAALGELGVDQPAGGIERALGLRVTPSGGR